MNSISKYENFSNGDGLELVVDTDKGLAYASISAAARMLGVSKQAVSKKVTVNQINVIKAKTQTATGLKTVNLIDSVALYNMALDLNIVLAKAMGAAGANVYMLGLAGYNVEAQDKRMQVSQKGKYNDIFASFGLDDMLS